MSDSPTEQLFLAAYDQYADAIFRFCYVQVGDRERAKDIVQEAFVRTWKYLAQGKLIDQIRPFLYRTARNVIIDQYRKGQTQSLDTLMEGGFDVTDDKSAQLTASIDAAYALKIAAQLDPKYREVITLRYIDDLAPREIAQIIGEKENVISVRLHRGLEKLRKLMHIES